MWGARNLFWAAQSFQGAQKKRLRLFFLHFSVKQGVVRFR